MGKSTKGIREYAVSLYKDASIFLSRKENRLKYIAFNDGTPYEVKVSRTV